MKAFNKGHLKYEIENCAEVKHVLSQHPAITKAPDGSLLLAYSDYTDAMEDATAYLVRSLDKGVTWGQPELVIKSRKPQGGTSITLGMQTLRSGRILLPWSDTSNQKKNPRESIDFICFLSDDSGNTWSGLEPQNTGLHQFSPYGKIVELEDGTLLCPGWGYMSKDEENYTSGLLRSFDSGKTWEDHSVISRCYNETDLTLLPDGRILAMLRSESKQPLISFSLSEDNGKSWAEPQFTNVTGQNFNAWLTPRGALVGACRGIDGSGKYQLSEIIPDNIRYNDQIGYGIHFLSAVNDGKIWNYLFTLPDPSGLQYTAYHQSGEPGFVTLDDNHILVCYYSYDESIYNTLCINDFPEYTRMQALRIPHAFKRRVCVCMIVIKEIFT